MLKEDIHSIQWLLNNYDINGDIQENTALLNKIFEKVAQLDNISQQQYLKLIKDKTKLDTISIKKELQKYKQKQPIPLQTLKLTNYQDNVQLFYQQQPFFYDKNKIFWFWNKKENKYEIYDEIDIMLSIDEALGFGGETVTNGIKGSYLEAFKRIGRLNVPDIPPKTWIQFKDLVVDIETKKQFKVTPQYFFCNPIPHKIGDSVNTPVMSKIFQDWVGVEYVETLYQILAYSLIPDYPIHRLFCLIGSGLNGKSKFLELVSRFVGLDNITTSELDTLLSSRFETTRLHKKLVCVMGETNFAELSQTSILKKLTGQDLIGFEYKGKGLFQDYSYAKIFIATNNLPVTTDKTLGFYRRWLIIDFPFTFTEKKDILAEIPEEEYENLALKSIEILSVLLNNREFHNEGDIKARQRLYEEKSNPFDKFFNENVERSSSHIAKWEFRERFENWCKENRFRILNNGTINKIMEDKGILSSREYSNWYSSDGNKKQYWAWSGISWKK